MEQRLEQALDEIEEIEKIDEPITLLSKLIETHHLFDTPASDYEQFRNQIEEWIRTLLTIFLKKYISKVSELNSTIALQQEELESNRYELITLREENEQLNDLSLHLTEQINKLKYYLDEADSISKTLREEIVDLRSDNKSLIMALNDVEAQNMKLIDELHNLERNMNKDPSPKNSPEKNNYIEENKKLQEIISQQSALLETYSAQEKENAELREKCESLRIQNRKLELAISEKEKYEHMYLELKEKYDSLLTASLLSPKRLDSSRHTSSHKEDLRSASENLPRKPLSRITSPRNSAFGVIISPRENFKENKDPNILDLGSHHKMASIESPSDPSVVIHNDNQEEEAEDSKIFYHEFNGRRIISTMSIPPLGHLRYSSDNLGNRANPNSSTGKSLFNRNPAPVNNLDDESPGNKNFLVRRNLSLMIGTDDYSLQHRFSLDHTISQPEIRFKETESTDCENHHGHDRVTYDTIPSPDEASESLPITQSSRKGESISSFMSEKRKTPRSFTEKLKDRKSTRLNSSH